MIDRLLGAHARTRQWFRMRRKELALLGVTVILCLVATEVALRVAGISYPIFHRLEPSRGWAGWPGMSGLYMEEGRAWLSYNSAGYRDREHTVAKAEGDYRIALIGDSFTEARGIPLKDTFWSVLGHRLARCPGLAGRTPEILNFGVSGYGPAQELVTLRRDALRFSPDLVIMAVYTGNDIWNSERSLDGHEDRVYALPTADGVKIDDSNTQTFRYRLKRITRNTLNAVIDRSRLLQLIRRIAMLVDHTWLAGKTSSGRVFDPRRRQYALYRPPADRAWKRAWRATEATIAAAARASRAAGARFLMVTLSNAEQVYPFRNVREAFRTGVGAPDLFYPDRRLAAFAEKEGFPHLALAPVLRVQADATGVFLHGYPNTRIGTGHWNVLGHEAAGRIMAGAVCRLLGSR